MRIPGLPCRSSQKLVVTTESRHKEPAAPNLLNRKFAVCVPHTVWVTDITYLKVGRKWHYLTIFIDLFSRIVVEWDLSDSLERHSAIRAFHKSIVRRRPASGLMVHSDRGIQFASCDFRAELSRHGCVQSMSHKGNCRDSAVAEFFFHTLKTQFIKHRQFSNRIEDEVSLFQYIEAYYSRRRRYSSNGGMSPAEFEQLQIMKDVA
ncbi:Transposase InsO and inactivated derivatives [Desulfobaculum bizertense DSM 18034]|uniref:Transposase InsO and inactivated derivatives n=1 Tax=Desulfobaculum bizertense DSM 18034 TaxID=1121442 RepID=A0A1T4VYQ3_9BACT|nr:Transposase InsO and inactivated derivatives [Desulfobaculum bizertense DSM 18034]